MLADITIMDVFSLLPVILFDTSVSTMLAVLWALLLAYVGYTVFWLGQRTDAFWLLHLIDYLRHMWPWLGVAILGVIVWWTPAYESLHPVVYFIIVLILSSCLACNLLSAWRYAIGWKRIPLPLLSLFPTSHSLRRVKDGVRDFWDEHDISNEMIEIVSLNLAHDNHDHNKVTDFLTMANADVVCLQEVTPEWKDVLASETLTNVYPHQSHFQDEVKPDAGMAILSRCPFKEGTEAIIEESHSAIQSVTIFWREQAVGIVNVHPEASVTKRKFERQQRHWRALDDMLDNACLRCEPVIIIGDFNACPWSPMLARLCQEHQLTDAQSDWGVRPTFPVKLPTVMIDNALATYHWQWQYIARGPYVGSDHYPLLIKADPYANVK